jgi:tetratricopeptide (TPR) repeat protein
MVLADRADRKGEEIFKRFKISGTPTVLFLAGDGSEVDWQVGYGPPPEKFQAKVENTVQGIDTFKSLSELYAKDPKKIDVVYKLAEKYDNRYVQDKAKTLYQEVLALDPDGKLGTTETWDGETVSYTELAEFSLGQMAVFDWKNRDPAPLKAFIAKYPQSKLLDNAYGYLSYYFQNEAKDKAVPFFEEYVAKFPDKPRALNSYVEYLIRTKADLGRGLDLARQADKLTDFNPIPSFRQNLAKIYFLKDDKDKAAEAYGKDFMEDKVRDLGYDLVDYADFWAKKKENAASALKMADLALKLSPDNAYLLSRAAGVYCALDKKDQALAVFGEAYAKKNSDKPSALASYARFWANQGTNLESALAAAKRANESSPSSYGWDIIATVDLKLKKYDDATKAAQEAIKLAGDQADYFKQRLERIKKAQDEEKKR